MERNSFVQNGESAEKGLTAGTQLCYHTGKPNGTQQFRKASEPPAGVPKGGRDLKAPNASELLVEQTQDAERLRLLILAKDCSDLPEFIRRLQELINRQ